MCTTTRECAETELPVTYAPYSIKMGLRPSWCLHTSVQAPTPSDVIANILLESLGACSNSHRAERTSCLAFAYLKAAAGV